MPEPRPIDDVLAYENEELIEKFLERYAMPERDARLIFREMKKWLWLCAKVRAGQAPFADLTLVGMPHMIAVDEMWHSFVLFTEEYGRFCRKYLRRFIHHQPATVADKLRAAAACGEAPARFRNQYLSSIRAQLRYVAAQLGVETVSRWLSDVGGRYTPTAMDALRRSHTVGFVAPIVRKPAANARRRVPKDASAAQG